MHFHVADIMGVKSSLIHDLLEQGLLRRCVRVRDGDSIGRMIGCCLEYDPQDTVVVGLGVFEPLQNDGTNPIASAI